MNSELAAMTNTSPDRSLQFIVAMREQDAAVRGQGRVMLVDDDEDLGPLLRDILHSDGFAVDLVSDGHEALRLLREHRPCLVLLDLKLGDMDGYELWEHLRQAGIPTRVPIYVFTAAVHVDESRLPGIAGLVRKPIDMDQLGNVLREACPRLRAKAHSAGW